MQRVEEKRKGAAIMRNLTRNSSESELLQHLNDNSGTNSGTNRPIMMKMASSLDAIELRRSYSAYQKGGNRALLHVDDEVDVAM